MLGYTLSLRYPIGLFMYGLYVVFPGLKQYEFYLSLIYVYFVLNR